MGMGAMAVFDLIEKLVDRLFFRYQLMLIECAVVAAVALVAFLRPEWGDRFFGSLEARLGRLARRQWLAVAFVALVALAGRVAVLPILPVPAPAIEDEFAYLLAADTFHAGRLTNPAHPMAEHFDTIHVLQTPSYTSIYPPAQGMVLALGQWLGHPFIGVWLSIGLMAGAFCWAFQGWFSPGWALFGAMAVVLRFCVFSYWANSYWGGAVAALGGALILGALGRLRHRPAAAPALTLGIGLAIVANSRPVEGAIYGAIGMVLLAVYWIRDKQPVPVVLSRVVLPLALVLVATGAWMAYYNWRTTEQPWLLPYAVFQQRYGVATFLWQKVNPPVSYSHPDLARFYEKIFALRNYLQSPANLLHTKLSSMRDAWVLYLGPALTLPVLVAIWRWRERSNGWFLLLWAVPVAFLWTAMWLFPHYVAPSAAALIALMVGGAMTLREFVWRGRPVGRFAVRAVPLVLLLMLGLRANSEGLGIRTPFWPPQWCGGDPIDWNYKEIVRELESDKQPDLVFVRYGPEHDIHREWVYNRADIDSANIVWARFMGSNRDQELIRYMPQRTVWLLEPDAVPLRLTPYRDAQRALPMLTGIVGEPINSTIPKGMKGMKGQHP